MDSTFLLNTIWFSLEICHCNFNTTGPKRPESFNFCPVPNAGIKLKDINRNGSGEFYRIHVNSEPTNSPTLFFNNNEVIDTSNLLNELENILQFQTLDTSNIIITGGYLNFANGSNPNTNQGETGVGIRYSANNTVQFKNYD